MTHTLHRRAGNDGLNDDYVILVMAAVGINKDDTTAEKYKNFLRIFLKHNPVNIGGIGIGQLYDSSPEKIIDMIDSVWPNLPMIHGVFNTREDLVAALKDIKEADMGISVIVTGLAESVDCCRKEAGLERHSINFSMGIWGDKMKLPDEKYLQIASMCGHAMISFNLINKMIDDIKTGSSTIDQAAKELAKPCVCGIFNKERAKKILQEFV